MITVLCGIIVNTEGEIFIARRKPGKSFAGKWEFPGGKLEEGESESDCLKRELLEELGMQVQVGERLGENVHHYPTFSIRLIAYHCRFVSASYQLTDHDLYAWVKEEEFVNYDLAEADVPLVDFFIRFK
jgi:8-oxo-dGTP diphosphatase